MSDPALVGSSSIPPSAAGVTAAELVEPPPTKTAARLSAAELERWLLEAGLAEPNGAPGRLVPTDRAFDLVKALTWLSSLTRYGPQRPA